MAIASEKNGRATGRSAPPQNLEAEESVLGAMMVSESTIGPVVAEVRLRERDFYRDRHRLIFRAIRDLWDAAKPVDVLTVSAALDADGELDAIGGRDVVASLAAKVPAPGSAGHYAEIVRQNSLMRQLDEIAKRTQQSVAERAGEPSELAELAEAELSKLTVESREEEPEMAYDIGVRHLELLEAQRRGEVDGATPTGYRDLDALIGGLVPGEFAVLAGRPGHGKSALLLGAANHIAERQKKGVLLFSLEMSEFELMGRLLAPKARVQSKKARDGTLSEGDLEKLRSAHESLRGIPLKIDDSPYISMAEIRAIARKHVIEFRERGGLGAVLIDYLQLVRPENPSDSRVEQVSKVSRMCKVMARELHVPVLAVSSLSRAPEQRPDKRPVLSDLRESGGIESDADQVYMLYRDEVYNGDESDDPGVGEVLVRKNRNGPQGTARLAFVDTWPVYRDLARGESPPSQTSLG